VAVCDVNGLKHINDTLGHEAGDEYICDASKMICICFRNSPVYRIGGDEFAVILRQRDYNDRRMILDRFVREAEENIKRNKVVVSIGISEYAAGRDRNLRDVFDRADERMYERKKYLKGLEAKIRR